MTCPANGRQPPDRIADILGQMQGLHQSRKHQELIDRFAGEDIAGWPDDWSAQAASALHYRGQSYIRVKDLDRAGADLELAVQLAPGNGYYRHTLGDYYRAGNKEDQALGAYLQAYEQVAAAHGELPGGWMPPSATINAADILRNQGRYDEALKVLNRYFGNQAAMERLTERNRIRILRARAHIYAGQGRDQEALALFRLANQLLPERAR